MSDVENMYHYTECGLDNIYLLNGYTITTYDGEECLSIHNVDALHHSIAVYITACARNLTPKEFKYLRLEMNFSQKTLSEKFGVDVQTIARWEKNQTPIPRTADILIRAFYMDFKQKEVHVSSISELIAEHTETEIPLAQLRLNPNEQRWQVSV